MKPLAIILLGLVAALPAPALGHHFAAFCRDLKGAAVDAGNVAELVTFARRRYEAAAGTDYLELPVSSLARSRAFATLLKDLEREGKVKLSRNEIRVMMDI